MTWLEYLILKFERMANAAEDDLIEALSEGASDDVIVERKARATAYNFVLNDLRHHARTGRDGELLK